ncbi:Crp/Fnr family transcriptional regulator [Pseudovibrio sp. Tun.PSC04-5.I4]|uniref:Crp/Fnr family transcriptional regulator n=1 Tax=Pseudovibrio sp. Tun.PSC04-5.I4 TaxID=1798213 RepID=UPI000886D8BC|nr:Crp/Fnr family transcriptional regulator [Pseudovibrio sp. Tun.PSC04-5.I4]SDQ72982.1 cAMP-binding domain of CRP or a regulatory subunit of cAMP-dependent protein kinases [Pseudovibrio sp. Tun.PSC04-5.I4]
MDLAGLIRIIDPTLSTPTLAEFEKAWKVSWVPKGKILARQGDPVSSELVILDGRAISQITDYDGRNVCVGFHSSPCIITPHVARTREMTSLVSLELTTDATIAELDAAALVAVMLKSDEVRDWANAVLREELARKTDREWCLAALRGAERLTWFRDRYPDHESQFSHGCIASFLGMTPVTLSRLRRTA